MRFVKGGLKRVQLIGAGCQPFHGGDLPPIGLHSEYQTSAYSLPIQQHGTRAADAMLTAHMRAGQSQFVADKITQKQARFNFALVG